MATAIKAIEVPISQTNTNFKSESSVGKNDCQQKRNGYKPLDLSVENNKRFYGVAELNYEFIIAIYQKPPLIPICKKAKHPLIPPIIGGLGGEGLLNIFLPGELGVGGLFIFLISNADFIIIPSPWL